ncbi:MAG: hypothetical protein AB7N76_00005 [Planctomycetota bacterium]
MNTSMWAPMLAGRAQRVRTGFTGRLLRDLEHEIAALSRELVDSGRQALDRARSSAA